MQRYKPKLAGIISLFVAASCLAFAGTALAQQSSSSTYQINEVFFGTGGELNSCSGSYCSKQSAGELTVGNTKGTAYQAQAGFNTDRTPWIEVAIVGSPSVDLGVLDTASTKTGTVQFQVKSYLSSGYVVQIYGAPPTNSGHALTAMTGVASSVGSEQFGMNLVANTSPSVGSNLTHDPDYPSQPFSFGGVDAAYATANTFKYASADVIASSAQSSSYTLYTISYVANISPVTPGGAYTTSQSLVATATY
ncbi:MAG: hypothetical protein WAW63_02000 [Candidatus Saccharimonadales bacterium]|nr:hypothetical protein [Candidatus Saccharibacteria bacterium]